MMRTLIFLLLFASAARAEVALVPAWEIAVDDELGVIVHRDTRARCAQNVSENCGVELGSHRIRAVGMSGKVRWENNEFAHVLGALRTNGMLVGVVVSDAIASRFAVLNPETGLVDRACHPGPSEYGAHVTVVSVDSSGNGLRVFSLPRLGGGAAPPPLKPMLFTLTASGCAAKSVLPAAGTVGPRHAPSVVQKVTRRWRRLVVPLRGETRTVTVWRTPKCRQLPCPPRP